MFGAAIIYLTLPLPVKFSGPPKNPTSN